MNPVQKEKLGKFVGYTVVVLVLAGCIHHHQHVRLWEWVQDQRGFTCSMNKESSMFGWLPGIK